MKTSCIAFALTIVALTADAHTLVENDTLAVSLGGNFQFDLGDVDNIGSSASRNGFWRRQRLSLEVNHEHVDIEAEFDATTNDWTDALVNVRGLGPGTLQLGQFKHYFGLDQLVSSRRTLFLERSLSDAAFILGRRLGAGYWYSNDRLGWAISAFGRNMNNLPSSQGGSARIWWTPQQDTGYVTHFGLAATHEAPDNDRLAFSARPSTRLTDFRVARTPSFTEVEQFQRIALESAGVRGSWMWQAEWVGANTHRQSRDFRGWASYAMVSYLFGERSRKYKEGVIGGITGDGSAFELGARLDWLDLDDGAVAGGKSLGFGVVGTWYLNPDSRLMLNVVRNYRQGRAPNPDLDPTVIETRFQFSF